MATLVSLLVSTQTSDSLKWWENGGLSVTQWVTPWANGVPLSFSSSSMPQETWVVHPLSPQDPCSDAFLETGENLTLKI